MTPLLCGSRSRRVVVLIAICATAATLDACTTNTAFERLTEARRLSAELLIRFTQASNAANQAVMADTDEASVAFAKQAEESKQTVEKNAGLLRSLLQQLNYSDELGFLETFTKEFAAYRDLDGRILELAVENTNLKAQRLSFGEAQQAADAFTESLNAVANGAPANDAWR
ncbi:MAG TPA: hypothetical protein VKB50_18410, partial [Vicinamibacterales bacterium]|nr:hypothetical protein [Vicinamibacterales bacterium]